MVKLIYCLRRLPRLSLEEFQRYWRENHGPLVQSVQKALRVKRYVQCHTIYDEKLGQAPVTPGRPEPFDGVAELWWDSLDDYAPATPDPERQKAGATLLEDEKKFIDLARSPVWLAEEHVFVDEMPLAPLSDKPTTSVKLIYCGHFLPSLGAEEAKKYWLEKHGPLVKSVAKDLGCRRYVQSHIIDDESTQKRRQEIDRPEAYPGVAELWWDSLEDYAPATPNPKRQQAGMTLFEDEKNFVDHPRSPSWLAREIVFIDNP